MGAFQPVDSNEGTLLKPAVMGTGVAEYQGETFVVWRVLLHNEQFEARLTVDQAREIARSLSEHAQFVEEQ
jgi:hypothetical protein